MLPYLRVWATLTMRAAPSQARHRRIPTVTNASNQISPAPITNQLIHDCFQMLSKEDRQKFTKKFQEQSRDVILVNHTLNELVVGTYLALQGFRPEYEPRLNGMTPEWVMSHPERRRKLLVELVNFHIDQPTEQEIEEHFRQKQVWAGWRGEHPNADRLYSSLQGKFSAYKSLVLQHHLPYLECSWRFLRRCGAGEAG